MKFAKIAAASSGANVVVSAVTGKKIRVLSVWLVAAGAVSAKFQSNTTDLTGAAALPANGGFVLNEAERGHFETAEGEALNLNLSGAVAVAGSIVYREV